jgi:hypothetical protein
MRGRNVRDGRYSREYSQDERGTGEIIMHDEANDSIWTDKNSASLPVYQCHFTLSLLYRNCCPMIRSWSRMMRMKSAKPARAEGSNNQYS